jgi:hypothetical protein
MPTRTTGRAVKDFVGSLVVAGHPGADGRVSPALDKQSCHPQPFVATLCDGVEDGRLPANTLPVYGGPGIDVGAPIDEEHCRLEVAVLSCDMEQCAPPQSETAAACCPEIELGEAPAEQRRVGIEMRGNKSMRFRINSMTAGTMYFVTAPAPRSMSMQALRSAERRTYDPTT